MTQLDFNDSAQIVIKELSTVFNQIDKKEVLQLVTKILDAEKVFVVGVGRVRIALSAFVKRLNHVGVKAWLVGDVNEPPITNKDLLIVGSGESLIPKNIAICSKKFNATLIHLTSSPDSSIAKLADCIVNFHCGSKSSIGIESIQPMTTLFEQSLFLFGDIICLELMKEKKISYEQVASNHANLE